MENFIKQLAQEYFECLRHAFINFIRQSYPLNGDEITDIYNEVWMDVIENIRLGRTERVCNWKSYIFGLGWRRAYKTVTRKTETNSLDDSVTCGAAYQTYCMKQAEKDALHMRHLEQLDILMNELDQLPEKHQSVLRLYYIEGMSTSEIAETMGYSGARTVITVKKRSLTLLQERMQAVA